MKITILTTLFIFLFSSSYAQTLRPSIDRNDEPNFTNASLVVGTMNMDFVYFDTQLPFIHTFDDGLVSLKIGSTKSFIQGSYGAADIGTFGEDVKLTNIRLDAQLGGDNVIFDSFATLPLSIHIPVRLNIGYQYLDYDVEDANLGVFSPNDFEDALQFLNLNLGAGLGGTLALPLGFRSPVGSQISIDAVYVRSLGTMLRFIEDEDMESGLSSMNHFMLQFRIHEFLGGRIGLTAGYKRNTLEWSSEDPGSFTDILERIFSADESMINSITTNMFFLGINW